MSSNFIEAVEKEAKRAVIEYEVLVGKHRELLRKAQHISGEIDILKSLIKYQEGGSDEVQS